MKAILTEKKLAIKKDDTVIVISGDDKGKTGKVLKVDPIKLRITVQGINIAKKHVKPSQKSPQGGIVSIERPMAYSKVMIVDAKGKPTRIAIKRVTKGGKTEVQRIAKTTGAVL